GYLVHPMVTSGLLLEHGCERTHNDALEDSLEEAGVDPKRFGWASVQLDGGIENVTRKVIQWFGEHGNPNRTPKASPGGIRDLGLGLTCVGNPPKSVACAFAQVAGTVVDLGGTIIIPEHSPLLNQPEFQNQIFERPVTKPTLAYGQSAKWRGLHIMETPTDHHVETLTGLGATGVSIILSFVDGPPAQAHPLVPVLQITTAGNPRAQGDQRVDWDLIWGEGGVSDAESLKRLWDLIAATAARRYNPRLFLRGNVDFQMTRGLLGVSL
ncbi:MAG TPA: altronate hydrolase, partial [Verrucomicrobiae bacterium]|nr:altronate hydrolase [Verrucomicrobiae bacterium]